jgi:hypothetical protein
MKSKFFLLTCITTSLFAQVSVEIGNGYDGYYYDGYYDGYYTNWYGPGYYYGVYFGDPDDYYGWRGRQGNWPRHHNGHDGGGHWSGGGGHGGGHGGGGHGGGHGGGGHGGGHH